MIDPNLNPKTRSSVNFEVVFRYKWPLCFFMYQLRVIFKNKEDIDTLPLTIVFTYYML